MKQVKIQDHLLPELRDFTGKAPDAWVTVRGIHSLLKDAEDMAIYGKNYKEALKRVANVEKEIKKFKQWLKKQK